MVFLKPAVRHARISSVAFAITNIDGAVDSAHEFAGQASEMFAGLAAMHGQLWEMRFGPDGTVNVDAGEFRACTGFDVAFHESKQTNRDARLVRMRQHEYRGKTYDFIAHVKGGQEAGIPAHPLHL